ncbi:SDR family NAD(P)-dependent oxidoreductase [Actinosynnema mirum]|uniref:Short-chain dehydrogenase/reductase SDR n=1 Tax=Actinosynnema mirum (strain ATCC 29888 / DSM 43827 / JCM 3225 / NBRC 14064 / NCIMB 13271 / NRRL B-12336 / IMRU 3971 / 101) TaxID=446462 RepID=C6W8N4_ACTMD|nr:SDR family oxidoreductase [Actinosynnema mirum]ACU37133.1 short-chain dehydrogenase/reductase SDR [Actinosynnema mirum DSM 43827]
MSAPGGTRGTVLVLGVGTGLGPAVARRFGREGYRVALVARNRDRLAALAAQLAGEGVEAAPFTADLSRPAEVPELVERVRARFGRIDVVVFAPLDLAGFTPAAELTAQAAGRLVDLYYLTPVALVRAVLDELRGGGSVLIAQSVSATEPAPDLSGIGPAMAATRNYAQSLAAEVARHGVHVATLQIGGMITGSAVHAALRSGAIDPDVDFPELDPADVAEELWRSHTARDRPDGRFPPLG